MIQTNPLPGHGDSPPANRSDGVDEDEMHLIRGYLNEDIPEYVGKLKRVAPKPDPMEVVDETSDKPEQL